MRSSCHSIDFFEDRDTSSGLASSIRINDFDDVTRICESISDGIRQTCVLWAGGIENRIDLVLAIEQNPKLRNLGFTSGSMRSVREPAAVAFALKQAGIPALDVLSSPGSCSETHWIVKPLKSGGGEQVQMLGDFQLSIDPDHYYLQQFVPGPVFGAVFIGHGETAEIVGCCRHLPTTSPVLPFRYEGSIGPAKISEGVTCQLGEIGSCLANAFNLRGWFGVDLVIESEQAWLLEVNPRFTASMELLDGRACQSLFGLHLSAFDDSLSGESLSPVDSCTGLQRKPIAAKQVLFNDTDRDLKIDAQTSDILWDLNKNSGSSVCDVPNPDWVAVPGSPICTIRGEGDSESQVLEQLAQFSKTVTSILM